MRYWGSGWRRFPYRSDAIPWSRASIRGCIKINPDNEINAERTDMSATLATSKKTIGNTQGRLLVDINDSS